MPFLGIDIGTSGTKALICDDKGRVLASANANHTLQLPKPGWTQQNPDEWWSATQKSVKDVIRKSKIKPDTLRGIGLSGQMHGSVFLDAKGKVIRPALLWNDQRTQRQCDDILQTVGASRMLELVGNLPMTGYTLPKLLWLRDVEPKNYDKLAHLILPKDYVRLQMTGEYATDVADASGMALVNQSSRAWSDELLSILSIDKSILPKLYESPEITGTLTASAAKLLGLKAGIPVVAGAGDVMSGAVGNGIVETGILNANLGTGGVLCAHADTPAVDAQGRVATMCSAVPGKWVVYGCMLSAAGSLQWYADEHAAHEHALAKKSKRNVFEILIEQAESAPAGCEGLFFLPYLTGERCPHNDPQARSGWIGMTRRTNRAMLVRSLLEGVTFNMGQIVKIMRDELKIPVTQVRGTGGGAQSKFWRQLQADIYNAPLAVTNSQEGGAFGVALLAGVGAGHWPSVEAACRATIKPTSISKPSKKSVEFYARAMSVYARLYHDLRERFAEMGALSA